MKRIVLALTLLVGGTAVAHASPPGLTEPAPLAPYAERGGAWDEGRAPMARHPRTQRKGPRAQAGQRRLPPAVRARLVQLFDRDGDGRLQGPERREARRFVKQLVRRHARAEGRMHRGEGRHARAEGRQHRGRR